MQRIKEFVTAGGKLFLRHYLLLILAFAAYRAATLHARFFNGIIWSDTEGYYLYLPAVFIHGGFEEIPVRTTAQYPIYEGTNKRFTKYTCGVAIMQAPFFLAAHGAAIAQNQQLDGYSPYYVRGIQLAALFYGFLGLFFLRRTLLRYFDPWVVCFTLTGLYFGTNLFHYMVQEPGMSHVYTFFLFSLFIYLTPRFYKRPGIRIFFVMGLLLGLITLIRPTNLILLFYLLLFGIRSKEDINERLQFIKQHFLKLLIAPVGSLLFFLPQFFYWHYMSGHWLMYSYGDEGFINWNNPRIDMVLFHIKNGWLLFSPMAGLAILGCLVGCWKNKYDIATIFGILLASIYIFSSWWCWWFGGAFGHRSFVEFYALLAFPYAYLATIVFRGRFVLFKILFVLLWLVLIYYSYMLTVHWTGPHYEWYEWRQVMEWAMDFRFDIEQ
jgi:hypothetical protein